MSCCRYSRAKLRRPGTKLFSASGRQSIPAMAQRMGLQNKDVVELELNGKKVEAAVWIQAGHPDNSITVFLGYGRRRAGRAGTGAGFDMYQIRPSATPWFTNGVNIRKT